MKSFHVAHDHACSHGIVCAVHIPDSPEPVPERILATLPEAEAVHAASLRGYRQGQFVGGRIALRQALGHLGVRPGPLLTLERGGPALPADVVGSVSHKRNLAIAMVARDEGWTLGCDLEDYEPMRLRIAKQVLRPEELTAIADVPERDQWIALVLRFSIKESIYKALDPYVNRYVAFKEASVAPDLEGRAEVALHLEHGEGPFEVEACYHWLWGRIVTSVRIRRLTAASTTHTIRQSPEADGCDRSIIDVRDREPVDQSTLP